MSHQTDDFEAAQQFIQRTIEEKPKTERSYVARSWNPGRGEWTRMGLFSGEAKHAADAVSKAAVFSPNRGRKKITSSGDGKRLAFPYDEAQGQVHVGQPSCLSADVP